METKVIIFFVGLTMFTSGIPNDTGMKAILPNVTYVDPTTFRHQVAHAVRAEPIRLEQATPAQGARSAPAPMPATVTQAPLGRQGLDASAVQVWGPQPHVEDHKAVIIFPTSLYDNSSTWPKTALQTDPNHSYVVLDRDFVRFVTQPPAGAPPLAKSGLILPSLAALCPGMLPLRTSYLPPYQGAAAVFDLANEGELSSCRSDTKANAPTFRFDSKLVLKTTAQRFTVSASTMTTTKELRLKLTGVNGGMLNVYVANIPKRFLAGDFNPVSATAIDGVPHYRAYYDMGASASSCTRPLKDWYDDPMSNASSVAECGFTFTGAGLPAGPGGGNPNLPHALRLARQSQAPRAAVPIPGEIPPSKIGALQVAALTFECSNTMWP